ncbi:amidase [Gordonia humi]|uniref:amidase n=1 Tax=Gordonia humi TaxID=686429 RepID=A0A840FCR6_9ACTN|nr:amidase [Gordonia humi]MBB4137910.1 amidase [Gordonia humi]
MKHVHAFCDDALGDLDATGVAGRIASGEISATEALESALARIDRVEPELSGLAFDDRDRARARLDHGFHGVFAGVPSAIKNNTDFAGLPTRNGSAATPAAPATSDEAYVGQFVGTGLNVLGATTTPAFGLTATTEFADRAPTRNPWDTDYSSGGSSGGSAALVAAGALPIAHGNDGGGSIRIPAAACGLYGLKPSRGRTAPSKMGASLPIDLISNGVITRSVRDSAIFLADVESRSGSGDLPPIGRVDGPGARRLRVALVNAPITGRLLDGPTQTALDDAVALLESLGHSVETVPLPVDRSFVDDFSDYWAMLAFGIDRFGGRTVGKGFDRSRLDPFTRGLSSRFLRRFYRTPFAIRGLTKATASFRGLCDRFDVVLSPTLAHTTPKIGHLSVTESFEDAFDKLIDYVSFTPANNVSGTPAVSLPWSRTPDGLPVAVHFSADLGMERTLLELSYELEAARPFARIQDA